MTTHAYRGPLLLSCFVAFIVGLFGLKSIRYHLWQEAHPLYHAYKVFATWEIIISIILGICVIPLLYWHCKVRRHEDEIFQDKELPFVAKYDKHDQIEHHDEEYYQRQKEKAKEYEYKKFRATMREANVQPVDNILSEVSVKRASPIKAEPTPEPQREIDLDLLCDFVPMVVFDPEINQTTYACPVCKDLVNKNQVMKVWTNCEHLVHSSCFEEWAQKSLDCPKCDMPLDIPTVLNEKTKIGNRSPEFDELDRDM